GTLLMGEPRAVRIDSFRVDLVPEGRFLVSRHEDRPGVVGRVGSILGEHDVNIASMQVGRDAPRGNAMMILAVDDRVAPEVLSRLREVGGVSDSRYVELGLGSDGWRPGAARNQVLPPPPRRPEHARRAAVRRRPGIGPRASPP